MNKRTLTVEQQNQAAIRRGQRVIALNAGKQAPLLGQSFSEAIQEHQDRGNSDDQQVVQSLQTQQRAATVGVDNGTVQFAPARALKNPSAKIMGHDDYKSYATNSIVDAANEEYIDGCFAIGPELRYSKRAK